MSTTARAPEQRTIDVDVESLDTRGRTVVGYAAVYDALSDDLGGFRERIAPGAFSGVLDADVRALLNHDPNEVLGRTKSGTLRLADEQRGLRFELDLPDSPLGENVRSAVSRGDLDGASFRFVVGDEQWADDVRTVTQVAQLHDITLATYPAYPAASIELRTRPKETTMEEVTTLEHESEENEAAEERTSTSGGLRTIQINEGLPQTRSLLDMFKSRGWTPGTRAEIAWQEFESASEQRSLTWSGTVDSLSVLGREAAPYGADQRYAWPAFPRVAIDSGVTSVQVLQQTARSLATAANVVRAIDETDPKPETSSTIGFATVSVKQIATIQSGIPNVMLESQGIESILGQDLRLAVNEGLDDLVLDALAASGTATMGTAQPMLNRIRSGMTTLYASGYAPDTLILDPTNAEALDILRTSGSEAMYVFGAGRFAPGELFGLTVRVSKTIPAPVVVDAQAFGKLYATPVSLAAFEENDGSTNTTLLRLEGHAAFGTERQAAAVRIATS